jgi:hypothetical protein
MMSTPSLHRLRIGELLRFDFPPVFMHFLTLPMTLSSHLQSPEFMRTLPALSREQLRDHIFSQGESWFGSHMEESDVIRRNCAGLGIECDSGFLCQVQHNILLHYYEKLLPFSMTPQEFHHYLHERIALPQEIGILKKTLAAQKGILLAVGHFGAVELIGPCLAASGIPFAGTLRFATTALSGAAHQKAQQLSESGLFAELRFIEIGSGQSSASLEMAAVLRRGGLLCAVFDEPTRYSTDVDLLGARIRGGAGIDRLISFLNAEVVIVAAFMTRTGNETYALNLSEITGFGRGLIQSIYARFETVCRPNLAQWYFLHEEIPFVK